MKACRSHLVFVLGSWLLGWVLSAPPAFAGVLVSEIMYHPASEDVRDEFLELHNAGSSPVDLEGWRLEGGIDFVFSPAVLPGGGYLVVAADADVFRARNPSVTNVVGSWTGRLSNRANTVEILDASGRTVNRIRYADDGDWADRIRDAVDSGHRGWTWYSAADGGGRSLELVNPHMPNTCGQNWRPSANPLGTPGQPNSVAATNSPPFVFEASQVPVLPRSTEAVHVTARILDESRTGLAARVWWRRDGDDAFAEVPMADDGQHEDGAPGDGRYGARLPAQTNHAVVEFYIEAQDAQSSRRTWPAPALDDGQIVQSQNALYQVIDEVESGSEPLYWLILRAADLAELQQINRNWPAPPHPFRIDLQSWSHAQFNGAFVSRDSRGFQMHYAVGIRNRGNSSNSKLPQSFRVNFPNDRPWKGVTGVNLNSQYPHIQVVGSVLYQHAGLPTQQSRPVRVRVNGLDPTPIGPPSYGRYAANEVTNEEFSDRHFPDDPGGNIYRCLKFYEPGANLGFLGLDPDPYRLHYFKQSNASEDDWSDLFELTRALDTAPAESYVAAMERVLNPRLWMRYFALETFAVNMETSLGNGHLGRGFGDDYHLYFGRRDPRAVVVAYDLDTILGQGDMAGRADEGLFRAHANPIVARFMQTPAFAPLYYDELLRLMDHTMSSTTFTSLVESAIGHFAPRGSIDAMNRFASDRRAFLSNQIPQAISVQAGLAPEPGGYRTPLDSISLSGRAHAARCRQVLINGQPVSWSAWEAQWSAPAWPLSPGLNRLQIQCLDGAGAEIDRAILDVWRETGPADPAPQILTAPATWSPADGTIVLTAPLTVAPGISLAIEPGAVIALRPGVRIDVQGQLVAAGTPARPIRFMLEPGAAGHWAGLLLAGPQTHRLAHVQFADAGAGQPVLRAVETRVDLAHSIFTNCAPPCVDLERSQFRIEGCAFSPAASGDLVRILNPPLPGDALLSGNWFGAVSGPHDAVLAVGDSTSSPVIVIRENTFLGSGGDLLDIRGLRAFIEANFFQGALGSAEAGALGCAVSADASAGRAAHVVMVRNLSYDCDLLARVLGGSFVEISHHTGAFLRRAAVSLDEPLGRAAGVIPGRGASVDASILWPAAANFTNLVVDDPIFGSSQWALRDTITSAPDCRLAENRVFEVDPAFVRPPAWPGQTGLTALDFSLRPNSPALGAAADGLDLGALVRAGAAITGEPPGRTVRTQAQLAIAGPGITHYRFKIEPGDYGEPRPVAQPIVLEGLVPGTHQVRVLGLNFAGEWQDPATPTSSRSWIVDPAAWAPTLRLNEILAWNVSGIPGFAGKPDLVEIHNFGPDAIDLGGMSLTDDPGWPQRHVFPGGAVVAGNGFLVLEAGGAVGPLALPFQLDRLGEGLYLFDSPARGGALLDSIQFGRQLADGSLGRLPDGQWGLCRPTFGAPNLAQPLGDPARLAINEWLAAPAAPYAVDFIELYNPGDLPVSLAGLQLLPSEVARLSQPSIPAASFIGPRQTAWLASSPAGDLPAIPWPAELPEEQGVIGLFDPAGAPIDIVFYGPQRAGLSQGRSPDGGGRIITFDFPSPGLSNPDLPSNPSAPGGPGRVWISELVASSGSALPAQPPGADWIELHNPGTNGIWLSDMSLSDDPALPRKWVFGPEEQLEAGQYRVLGADSQLPASASNLGFGFNASGETVYLFASAGEASRLIDSLAFGLQLPGWSVARIEPDGSWALAQPTPGGANIAAALGDPARLRINEWMARPLAGDDWFEIYNPEPRPVALGGLHLSDDPSRRDMSTIPPLSFIGAGDYRVFQADDHPENGADHVAFKLSAEGDLIGLYSAELRQIDAIEFAAQTAGVSQGRLPDGSDTIAFFTLHPSPAAPNASDSPGLDLDMDGLPDSWEIAYGFDRLDPLDAALDPDADGMSNLEEYLAGTHPRNPLSRLSFVESGSSAAGFTLSFVAVAGRSYTVQFTDNLAAGPWHDLLHLAPAAATQTIVVSDPFAGGADRRYYRIIARLP
ncbi:MAG TPA: lamin tail domain-containing protein [Candidatus Paceibacterota bacterium]|nr:lamin tail domain-containing protein [Verrucomicrobiota bacterium]HRZ44227.1 lamin tail domain-containing protein [Candidatus Paceibacterota bacterium]